MNVIVNWDWFPWDDLRKVYSESQGHHGTKRRRKIAENSNRLSRVLESYRQTTDRRNGDST